MDLALFERKSEFEWHIRPFGNMHVPGVIFASEMLLREMDAKVYEQVTNVAMLPGIVEASWAMPDAHWGYGFPIGGGGGFWARSGRGGAGGVAPAAELERTEEGACMHGPDPSQVSDQAKKRQRDETGTMGSGNHYL